MLRTVISECEVGDTISVADTQDLLTIQPGSVFEVVEKGTDNDAGFLYWPGVIEDRRLRRFEPAEEGFYKRVVWS